MRTSRSVLLGIGAWILVGGWSCEPSHNAPQGKVKALAPDSKNQEITRQEPTQEDLAGLKRIADATAAAAEIERQADEAAANSDFVRAEELYRRALAASPQLGPGVPLSEAPYKLALLYLDLGRFAEAKAEVVNLRKSSDPERLDPVLCIACLRLGQMEEAAQFAPKVFKHRWSPTSGGNEPDLKSQGSWEAVSWSNIAAERFSYEPEGRPSRFYGKAADLLSNNPLLAFDYGWALGSFNHFDQAIEWLTRAKASAKGELADQVERDLYKFKNLRALGKGR